MAGTRELKVVILGDASSAQKALNSLEGSAAKTEGSLKATGEKLSNFGKKASLAMTLPIVAVGAVVFNAASDLNESMSKVSAVFGKQADDIQTWAKKSATAFGLSRQAALEAVGTFGNFLISMGNPADAAADMSKEMVKLAADLASFNNVSVDEALIALRSGLAGEAEPLRRFGVSLSAARIESEGAAVGINKLQKDMTASEKSTLAYQVIMKDTALAQGDFARTSGGAANKARIMKAQLDDTAASLGKALQPVLISVMTWVGKLAERFNNLSPTMQKTILIAGGLLAVIGPIVGAVGAVIAAVTGLNAALGFLAANPVVLIIAALVALGVGLVVLYQKSETFRAIVDGAFHAVAAAAKFMADVAVGAFSWIKKHLDLILIATGPIGVAIVVLKKNWSSVMDALGTAIQVAWKIIEPILHTMAAAIDKVADALGKVGGAAKAIGGAVGKVGGAIGHIPGFDSGGVVPGPRGAPQLILAHGGETVLPTHKQPAAGANIVMQIDARGLDPDAAGDAIGRHLGWRLSLAGGS